MAIRGLRLSKAQKFLQDVLEHKQAVPFRRFTGGIGRHAQVKQHFMATQCRWPKKSCEFLIGLLRNAASNAEVR
jgi:large subunit ribosomal protein L17e